MLITTIIEVVFKIALFAFDYFKASDENKKWLAESVEAARQKGWVRSEFLLKHEKSSSDYIDEKKKAKAQKPTS